MNEIKDGGPAFPTEFYSGMSLRDWFAGQALPQVMAIYDAANGHTIGADHFPRNCTAHAYKMADAMLAAREVQS